MGTIVSINEPKRRCCEEEHVHLPMLTSNFKCLFNICKVTMNSHRGFFSVFGMCSCFSLLPLPWEGMWHIRVRPYPLITFAIVPEIHKLTFHIHSIERLRHENNSKKWLIAFSSKSILYEYRSIPKLVSLISFHVKFSFSCHFYFICAKRKSMCVISLISAWRNPSNPTFAPFSPLQTVRFGGGNVRKGWALCEWVTNVPLVKINIYTYSSFLYIYVPCKWIYILL